MFRCAMFLVISAVFSSCSVSKKIIDQIAIAYQYGEGKVLGGNYVEKKRAFVLKDIPKHFLKDFDSLVIIERYRGIQDYYHCAVFSDSLNYFYQAEGLQDPKRVDVDKYPFKSELSAIHIFNMIKQGELSIILKQAENTRFTVHASSLFLTIIRRDGKNLYVSGYNLHEFVPKERMMELDSMKNEIRQKTSN